MEGGVVRTPKPELYRNKLERGESERREKKDSRERKKLKTGLA